MLVRVRKTANAVKFVRERPMIRDARTAWKRAGTLWTIAEKVLTAAHPHVGGLFVSRRPQNCDLCPERSIFPRTYFEEKPRSFINSFCVYAENLRKPASCIADPNEGNGLQRTCGSEQVRVESCVCDNNGVNLDREAATSA